MSRVLLIDVDSKIPNLALMKLSAWHKRQGDEVHLNSMDGPPDRIYASSVFTRSRRGRAVVEIIYNDVIHPKATVGGTGWSLKTKLPKEIESMIPDYDLYGTDTSMGFTTRGCVRKCPWCVVPEKEGRIATAEHWREFHAERHDKIMLLDNNLLAAPREWWKEQLTSLAKAGLEVKENGLDCRLVDDEAAYLLKQVRWHSRRIHLAFDEPKIEPAVRRSVKILTKAGFHSGQLMFYVLVGFDTTPDEDEYRVRLLDSLDCDVFIMPHANSSADRREFARMVNGAHKRDWDNWQAPRKGRVGML